MRVVVLGPGGLGTLLAEWLSDAHHEVMLSAYRDAGKAEALAEALGCRLGDLAAAREFGQVFFLCVPHAVAAMVLKELRPSGLVVDCTNQVGRAVPGDHRTSTEVLAEDCPKAVMAKAFNTHTLEQLRSCARIDGHVAVPFCCDSEAGVRLCEAFIRDCGFTPVHVGPLDNSAMLEPHGPFFRQVMTPEAAEQRATLSMWEGCPPIVPMY